MLDAFFEGVRNLAIRLLRAVSCINLLGSDICVYSGGNFGYSGHGRDVHEYLIGKYPARRIWYVSQSPTQVGLHLSSWRGVAVSLFCRHFALISILPTFVSPRRKRTIQFWHGISIKSSGVHDRSLPDDVKRRMVADFSAYTAVVCAGEFDRESLRSSFRIADASRIHQAPSPYILKLLRDSSPLPTGTPRIVLYAPTFRESSSRSWDLLDNADLVAELKARGYELVARYHPFDIRYSPSDATISEQIRAASLVVTDYSSVGYDAILMGRPVLLYCPDYDDYAQERGFTPGGSARRDRRLPHTRGVPPGARLADSPDHGFRPDEAFRSAGRAAACQALRRGLRGSRLIVSAAARPRRPAH